MKQLDFTSLNDIAKSNISQDLSNQTMQNIRNVQVPTVEGFIPSPVVLPIVESVLERENEMRGSVSVSVSESQPPALPHYYLAINNEPKGPFTQVQVKDFLANGIITYDTLCWQPNLTEWVLISCMKEFNI